MKDHDRTMTDWQSLPVGVRNHLVEFLRSQDLPFEEIRKAHAEDSVDWAISLHSTWGMEVRNLIRESSNILESSLPIPNWDYYYIQAVEIAAGVIPYWDT